MIIKKYVPLLLTILLSTASTMKADSFVEAKVGYFYPTDRDFRKIYSNGGAIYGLEGNTHIWCDFYFWASGSFFTKSGFSTGEKLRTRVTLVPLAGGLKYVFPPCGWVDFYIAGGVVGTYLQTSDDSIFVIGRVSKWGVGGIGKLGALVNIYECLFLDLFADYTYMRIPFHNTRGGALIRHTADVSGVSAGGGISFYF